MKAASLRPSAREVAPFGAIGDFLDPHEGGARVIRALPCLRNGAYRVLAFDPERFDVTETGVALQGSLRLRHAVSGREETRPVHIGGRPPANGSGGGEILVGDGWECVGDLVGADPVSGACVRLSPADADLASLFDVLSPAYLGVLAGEATGHVRGGSGARRGTPRVEILAHRFGKRITLRTNLPGGDVDGGPGDEAGVLVKVYSGNGDELLARALRALGSRRNGSRSTSLPRLVHHDERRRAVAVSWVPGVPARRAWERGLPGSGLELGAAVRAWQEAPGPGLGGYDAAAEIRTIRKFAARVSVFGPEIGQAIAERARGWLDDVPAPAERTAFAHRDLHDKQVLRTRTGVGIIDWDLAALAPAGLDPGNYLAHLRLRCLQGRLGECRMAIERRAFLSGFEADDAGRHSGADVEFWERLTLLRLAAVYALRPGSGELPRALLSCAIRERGRS